MMAEFIFFLSLFLIGVKIGNWLGVKIGKWLYTTVHKNDEKRIIVNEMTKNPKVFLDSWIKMKEEQEKARKVDEVIEDTEVKNVISEEPDSTYDIDKILANMAKEINDAKKALKKLGYNKTKVKNSVTEVLSNTDVVLTSEEIVKQALNILNN